ncbi:hypothetical protein [Streptomyces sp. NPDC002490]|uniref:hypothetical protein n=1 Tax=Streptomyces sp. NPDC002490 TaxID=3154416 RepID=UPI00332642D4
MTDYVDLASSKAALGQIAQGITDTLGELNELGMVGRASTGRGFSDLALTGLQTGHDGLSSTLENFCERWEWGVRRLVQQGNEFADDVGLSAGVLHEVDQYVHGSLKVVVNAGIGNPYATEDEITGKDWGEVLSSNPYTHIRDADYSRESFEAAAHTSQEAWKGATREVFGADHLLQNQVLEAVGVRDEVRGAVDRATEPEPAPREGDG